MKRQLQEQRPQTLRVKPGLNNVFIMEGVLVLNWKDVV